MVVMVVVMMLLLLMMLTLVATTRVGVVVDSRVSGQFIGARKLFAATRELAGVWLLTRVSADMSCLVFEAMECLVTERTFVRAGKLICRL